MHIVPESWHAYTRAKEVEDRMDQETCYQCLISLDRLLVERNIYVLRPAYCEIAYWWAYSVDHAFKPQWGACYFIYPKSFTQAKG